MSQSHFVSNPFSANGGGSSVNRIDEEEENITSPTDPVRPDAGSREVPRSTYTTSTHPHTHTNTTTTNTSSSASSASNMFGASPFGSAAGQHQEASSGFPNNYSLGRRTSVSAESLNPTTAGTDSWTPPHHPKSPAQLSRLQAAVSSNFLFAHLDDDQFKTVLDALVEKPVPAKDIKVITQGDAGDFFYIVESGHFDIHIHPSGTAQPGGLAGLGAKVTSIGPGGAFGELALMYNAPRAATVISTEPSTLWALDRITFRRILMDSAFQRRRMYEAFLEEVPLLSSLKPYERSKIADALDTVKHPSGATIIAEEYKRGDYFGELALLDDKPRQATVVSKTEVKVAKLGRDGFKRLLGPVEEIMRREDYGTASATDSEAGKEQKGT
ncbi:cAMP-dependent protein kinase regulatory subunit [Trichophyton interdigitale MR816]|uniref:cAMP-dependent protein kinase regulatory subunit n=1 Tax=Trichophyton interdigitale (strain MR816) TaxID=1215338 RepID=A0A059IX53_TRIIM|nr:cAMP-dependent protein kinase regulatory subunit [Trichophyton interdigitale MR816]